MVSQLTLWFLQLTFFLNTVPPVVKKEDVGNEKNYGVWASFSKIALALIAIVFFIRCIALMRLAIAGKGNVMEVALKLAASILGILLVKLFF